MTGTVVRVKPNGFGFIKPTDGGNDVFFHAQALVDVSFDDLKEGDTVSFDVEQGPKVQLQRTFAALLKVLLNKQTFDLQKTP